MTRDEELHAKALDYVRNIVRTQDNHDSQANYLRLPSKWDGQEIHPDVVDFDLAVQVVLEELRMRRDEIVTAARNRERRRGRNT